MATDLPLQDCIVHNHHFNSTKWDAINFRDNDIVIATAYKSGTTWCQNIILQLLFQGREIPENHGDICPWVDLRVPSIGIQAPILEALTERRILKTHLKLNALRFSTKAKYIYIGRDGRDCFMSLINHYRSGNDLLYDAMNNAPGMSSLL
jgi:aryl sulfotransferase